MKVYSISDIHSDYKDNMQWVQHHCQATQRPDDILIVAGDISDDLQTLRSTLEILSKSYGKVFYTPGNHELWTRKNERAQYDSLGKLQLIKQLCSDIPGVFTTPQKLDAHNLWIVPIWSWYHSDWDQEPDVPGALPIEKVMMDFHACSWASNPSLAPSGDDSLARYFDALNDENDFFNTILQDVAQSIDKNENDHVKVISFSHFLPVQSLLPEKRLLHYPNLAKASGSVYLAHRVHSLKPLCHVFGHTHFTQDQMHDDGVRYVQWPLGYPRETMGRRGRGADGGGTGWGPLAIWDSELEGGSMTPQRKSYWSDYYARNQRQAHIVTPAPWVVG